MLVFISRALLSELRIFDEFDAIDGSSLMYSNLRKLYLACIYADMPGKSKPEMLSPQVHGELFFEFWSKMAEVASLEEKLASLKQELKYYESQISAQISAINSAQRLNSIDLKSDPRNALPLLQAEVVEMIKESQVSTWLRYYSYIIFSGYGFVWW